MFDRLRLWPSFFRLHKECNSVEVNAINILFVAFQIRTFWVWTRVEHLPALKFTRKLVKIKNLIVNNRSLENLIIIWLQIDIFRACFLSYPGILALYKLNGPWKCITGRWNIILTYLCFKIFPKGHGRNEMKRNEKRPDF